eukprot:2455169-Pyramimonas_sp.AAC.1
MCIRDSHPPQRGSDQESPQAASTHFIETFDGSSWSTLESRLERTDAAVFLAQEVGVSEEMAVQLTASARALGWH